MYEHIGYETQPPRVVRSEPDDNATTWDNADYILFGCLAAFAVVGLILTFFLEQADIWDTFSVGLMRIMFGGTVAVIALLLSSTEVS